MESISEKQAITENLFQNKKLMRIMLLLLHFKMLNYYLRLLMCQDFISGIYILFSLTILVKYEPLLKNIKFLRRYGKWNILSYLYIPKNEST